jgi:branched-subunit amino acid transport protein AzlD
MSRDLYSLILIAVMAIVTAIIRFFPFIIFRNKTPKAVIYLGKVLPFAVIGMLIIYCLKDVSVIKYPYGLPELIAIIIVAGLHKWRHNTLLSMVSGVVSYMLLVQLVFK